MLRVGGGRGIFARATAAPAPAPSFSPLSLFASGEQGVWIDPSDFSTMWQDSAGTTPVTAATQPVGRILDKSGNGYIFTQTTDARRPTLAVDASGNYYLSSDGVSKSLISTATVNMSAAANCAMLSGVYFNSSAFQYIVANPSTVNGRFDIYRDGSQVNGVVIRTNTGDTAVNQVETIANATLAVYGVAIDYATASNIRTVCDFYINGVQGTDTGGSNGTNTAAMGNLTLVLLASDTNGVYSLNGRMYQYILRGGAWTAGELDDCTAYVNTKTGAY